MGNIERNDRICTVCNLSEVGDEFHYLFKCTFFKRSRRQLVPEKFLRTANSIHFYDIMNLKDEKTLLKVCKFLDIILKYFKNPPGN